MADKYSLVIGRFQPLHDGHKAMIQTLLDEGKRVCVAIMDTGMSDENPYSLEAREAMVHSAFGNTVKVVVIPPIEDVCYGRDVGWGMRRVHHDSEHIRATDIRQGQESSLWHDPEFAAAYKRMAERVHALSRKQEFWPKDRNICEPIALAHSELSEALEAARMGNPPDKNIADMGSIEVQLSDVLGILMDMECGYGFKIAEALGRKMKFNESRGKRHGKRF
jgi:hypothetical protein